MTFREIVAQEFALYGALTTRQLDELDAHFALLSRWNAKLNLTRIESTDEAAKLHYCESLYVAMKLPPGPLRIADIGTGAGFPGTPMAILRPEIQVTLVESHQRKAVFLRESTRDLPNVRVFAGRAETMQEQFDWLVSRAVTPGDVLALQNAPRYGLLVGPEDAARLGGTPLPWGKGRFLALLPPQ